MTDTPDSTRPYALVLLALLLLTALTTGVAFIDLGAWSTPVALLIAGAKASLVALFFMHLRGGARVHIAVAVGSLFWLGILLTLTLDDYLTRRFLTHG
ncbi:MAG: cytochrome C oxidase subunit IV family protein [Vicinamibacterales bacterium]